VWRPALSATPTPSNWAAPPSSPASTPLLSPTANVVTTYPATPPAWPPATACNWGASPGDWLTSLGGELYLDTYLGFSLPVNLRLGWARGRGPYATTSAYLQWRVPLW